MTKPRRPYPYLIGVLIGIDQLANAIAGGDPDETISSRIGRLKAKSPGQVINWRRHPLHYILDRALEKIDPGHCLDSIGS